MPVKFSNPRLRAEFTDWPMGGNKRGTCVFHAEFNPGKSKGWRVGRTTTGKTKFHTYGGKCAIVDGDDGRTYILQIGTYANAITVSRSDFMNPGKDTLGFDHYVTVTDPLHAELFALIEAANAEKPAEA